MKVKRGSCFTNKEWPCQWRLSDHTAKRNSLKYKSQAIAAFIKVVKVSYKREKMSINRCDELDLHAGNASNKVQDHRRNKTD